MNGLFTLKDLLEKKGHKAYASGSGSTHILIWVKIATRERINPVYERKSVFLVSVQRYYQ